MRLMPRTSALYIGIRGHVVALDRSTGEELWKTPLKGREFVSVSGQGAVYAGTKGELFCLDPATGSIRWQNPLKGMGLGLISFGNETTASAELTARQAAAAAAASAGS